MDYKSELVPIMGLVVEKAMKAAGKGDPDEIKVVKDKIEDVVKDEDVAAKIVEMEKEELKILPPKPETFDRLSAFVRPFITILLTAAFVFLIASPFVSFLRLDLKEWGQIFASFMGVFGTIIGFWFGERSALKVPGGKTGAGAGAGAGAAGAAQK